VEKIVVDVVKKAADREKMAAKEKAKLREDAVRGLETKFEMIELFSQTDSIEHLETINDVALMIGDVTKRLKQYDMMDVFKLHLPSATDPTTARKTVDLITKYATATLEEVCESVEFFRTWGLDYDLENINWTLEFLENSQFMAQLPNVVVDMFPFLATVSGIGMHEAMVHQFLHLCVKGILFGTYSASINEIKTVRYWKDHLSYLDVLSDKVKGRSALVEAGATDYFVPQPFYPFKSPGEYNGILLKPKLVRSIFLRVRSLL
jgi:hypothetical protein